MATSVTQHRLPFLFLRGGTSRGPYFSSADLPHDRDHLSRILVAVIGAGNSRNIDGIGGGTAVTTKAAILSPSGDPSADVDYLFAQVSVEERLVDFAPTCGNILVGVAPPAVGMGLIEAIPVETILARVDPDDRDGDGISGRPNIEMGLIAAGEPVTGVRIRAVNTGALIEAVVRTPGGVVQYEGETAIDGVPGRAAPVALNFLEVTGSRTGSMFPTGRPMENIGGIPVSCVDVAMPMVIARAADFGISGHEDHRELDSMPDLFARMEAIRKEAGWRMGLGDVTRSVVPKFGLVAAPGGRGHFAARYFMPWTTHPTLAVTGSQCLAATEPHPSSLSRPASRAPQGSLPAARSWFPGQSGHMAEERGRRELRNGTVRTPVQAPGTWLPGAASRAD